MASRGPGNSTPWQPSAPVLSTSEAFQTAAPEEEFRSRTPPPSYDDAMRHPVIGQGQPPMMQGQLPPAPQYNPNWVKNAGPVNYMGYQNGPQQGPYQAPQQVPYQGPQQGPYQGVQQGPYQGPQKGPYQGPQPYMGVPAPMQATVVHGAFNAGARFDGIARPSIPPPPPGVVPNEAQLAAMKGQHVVLASKKKNDFWGGGAGGGSVFW
ncbi:unnamed protein product [Darwinula stevensoni]|uniref:DAZ-associated protein 2 n=1 Tax=Darwinula stevensoni TaxID=69355 RepID=A0A7R9AB46_9CRUS|nr:unnamed protein product [Darwinula stevensoni]CAG0898867.1 unnamed protein product [Darwinula stevensoni]